MNNYDILQLAKDLAKKDRESNDSNEGVIISSSGIGGYRVQLKSSSKSVLAKYAGIARVGQRCQVDFVFPNTWIITTVYESSADSGAATWMANSGYQLSAPINFRTISGFPSGAVFTWSSPADDVVAFEVFTASGVNVTGVTGTAPILTTRGSVAMINSTTPIYARARSISLSGLERSSWTEWVLGIPADGAENVRQAIYFFGNALVVGQHPQRIVNHYGSPRVLSKVVLYASTAPTGSSIIVDVLVNNVTIFTNPANRPVIATSANNGSSTVINAPSWAAGAYMEVVLAQVGSTIAGSNLTATLVFGS